METESSELRRSHGQGSHAAGVERAQLHAASLSLPGVSNQTGQDEGTVGVYGNVNWSINGGRNEYNNWELDGGDNMDNGSNSTLNVYPSVEAIAEFKVLTSNYGAQYGRNGSGTIETVTKSGTKDFHGDVYEFVRNDAFNARNYFSRLRPLSAVQEERFWIHHRRAGIYPEGIQQEQGKNILLLVAGVAQGRVPGQNFNNQVPSSEERQGNFNDVCPNPATNSFADCPKNPATGAYYPNNTGTLRSERDGHHGFNPGA